MVSISSKVRDKIQDYVIYITSNFLCSKNTAEIKKQNIFKELNSLDNPHLERHVVSTHHSFGKKEGYLYGFFKDKKSKAQWNYLYERFEEDGEIKVIVHDICCGGLKDSYQFFASLTTILTENFKLGNMLREVLLK